MLSIPLAIWSASCCCLVFISCCIKIDDWGHFRVSLFFTHIWRRTIMLISLSVFLDDKGVNKTQRTRQPKVYTIINIKLTILTALCRSAWSEEKDANKKNQSEIEKLLKVDITWVKAGWVIIKCCFMDYLIFYSSFIKLIIQFLSLHLISFQDPALKFDVDDFW